MSPDPDPDDLVLPHGPIQFFPQLQVLDLATLPFPSTPLPAVDPLLHPFHEVLGVGDEPDPTGTPEGPESLDGASKSHPVVGGIRFRDPVVTTDPALTVPELHQSCGSARILTILELVAQTRLVGVDIDMGAFFGNWHGHVGDRGTTERFRMRRVEGLAREGNRSPVPFVVA